MIAALASPLARWAAVAAVLLSLLAYAQWQRAGAVAAAARADTAEAALHVNAQALADLAVQRDRTIAALDRQAAAAEARGRSLQPVRRMIDAAPDSRVCTAAGPVRAALDGLRARQPAAGAGGAPEGAGQPPRAPAGPGAAVR
jgi:hypothetical protein